MSDKSTVNPVEDDKIVTDSQEPDKGDATCDTDGNSDLPEDQAQLTSADSSESPEQAEQPDQDDNAALEVTAEDMATVEAILFTTDTPISPAKIAEVAQLSGGRRMVLATIAALNERYEDIGCAFRIEPRAAGFRMFTQPEHNEVLGRLLKVRNESRLSPSALETLSIIAYKQPVLRVDIEAIRGVSSGEMVRGLMEKGLVKIVGRAEEIGRPMLYGTTSKFLEVFGLNTLKDLPEVDSSMLITPKAIKPNGDIAKPGESPDENTEDKVSLAIASPDTQADSSDQPEEKPSEGQAQAEEEKAVLIESTDTDSTAAATAIATEDAVENTAE